MISPKPRSSSAQIQTDRIDLVIFDCDGVLVDSEPLSNHVMAVHITRLGWPMSGEEAMRLFKGSTMAQVHTAIETRLSRPIDPAWREAFHREQEVRMRTELQPFDGIRELIQRVQLAGLSDCVASQGRHEKMAISLGATGLLHHFEGRIFSAVDVDRPKPFPDLFLYAARKMKVDPKRCLVIEDSAKGVQAATSAGMEVIFFDSSEGEEDAHPPVTTVNSLDDIQII